ncbi:splicing regulatory glutamine/lysine-rich protein 1 isoform X2 [Pseudochaenichthys georgianus]|uniref:splicing regulatory glutamine/lysine-rich protein 1 isoform X2 n=1 Tax=Pseudochaenichthys georgianus TaxID=52239 RepID=UPI00146A06A0|nr:splicing regulatory glutamine/lysine-rich protein 1 isoform X2 [Pseudochaenichthys georgianus]
MSGIPGTAVVQVTNLSSAVSSEQMRTLFGFLGDIDELRLYPPDNAPLSFSSKVCYIKYRDPSSVCVAQHLTNTVFIDRALIVVPCAEGKIPEEAKALSLLAPAAPAPSLIPGGGLLPIPTPAPAPAPLQNLNVPAVSRLSAALDPTASSLTQAPLMGNVDPSKVDEIRRTVYVGNLNSQTTNADQLLEFFKQVGEVKFVRMAGDETQPTRFAFVEFVGQESVNRALTFNGVMFGDRPLKVNHSNNAIVKPPEMTPQAAAKELESVMKRVREAQCTIAAAIDPADLKKRSPSRSQRLCRSRSRSRSRSKMHRKRSRSKQRPAPKLCPKNDSHNSRSSHRRSSLSRDKKHSRSRSMGSRDLGGHRRKSKDRSRSPRRKARSPSPKRGRKDKRGERSRDRKERSTSRKKSRKDEERMKSKAKPMKVERDYDREEKDEYESDREDTLSEGMMSSPCAQQNGSYKTHNEYASMGADNNKGLFHRHGN